MAQHANAPGWRAQGAAGMSFDGDRTYLTKSRSPSRGKTDFEAIARAALAVSEAIVPRWLPNGRRTGFEWVARNPRRDDRHPGSFSVNLRTGRWADFASGDRGGDLISLAAYLFDLTQIEAAKQISAMLGLEWAQ